MLGLQGERTPHIDVYLLISLFFHHIHQEIELLHRLHNDLWDNGYTFVEFRTDVSHVLRADTSCFHAEERGIIRLDSTHDFVVESAINIVSIALQRGEMDR